MYQSIQNEIIKQINVYKSDESRIVSDYEKEQETFKEYNGRQVLELLQNADDEQSNEVLIKINTKDQILDISNKGKNCNPFSIDGIKSLMLSNFSPKKRDKNRKKYIGNKGLGFRSIVNWSEQITIYSNNLQIDFSYDISKEIYKKETKKDVEKIMQTTMHRSERWIKMQKAGISDEEIEKSFYQPTRMVVFSWYGDIDTTMTPYDSILYYKKILRAGFVSIEPETGHIKAYVGGINYNYFKYDHVMVARRQVGSTFKPFVYTLAMMPGGYSPCYKVLNIPYTIDVWNNGNKEAYTPKFSKSKFDDKMISLKMGLALSLNQISAWVIKQYGPESVIRIARSMGVESPLPAVYSLCVGAGEVKLIEMVSAYCTFANHGVHVSPIFVTKIEDRYGNVMAKFTPEKNQAIDENTAYRVVELMRGVVQFGTSVRLRTKYKLTNDIAGKTGTTNDNSDGWFIGVTPHLVSGAWVGGEERSIRFSSTAMGQGASMALPIWAFYMQQVYNDPRLPYKKTDYFKKPAIDDGVETDCDDFHDVSDDNNSIQVDF